MRVGRYAHDCACQLQSELPGKLRDSVHLDTYHGSKHKCKTNALTQEKHPNLKGEGEKKRNNKKKEKPNVWGTEGQKLTKSNITPTSHKDMKKGYPKTQALWETKMPDGARGRNMEILEPILKGVYDQQASTMQTSLVSDVW